MTTVRRILAALLRRPREMTTAEVRRRLDGWDTSDLCRCGHVRREHYQYGGYCLSGQDDCLSLVVVDPYSAPVTWTSTGEGLRVTRR